MRRIIKDKTIYLLGLYETIGTNKSFMSSTYLALSWTYNCNVLIVNDPKELPNLHSLPYVAIEEKTSTTTNVVDFVHPKKAVYLIGNPKYSHPSYWANADYSVHIDVPKSDYNQYGCESTSHPLYGCQAAAIVLNDRYIKNGKNI